jgi:hypothetical protein
VSPFTVNGRGFFGTLDVDEMLDVTPARLLVLLNRGVLADVDN